MIPYAIGKSGLRAQQTAMEITAHDLANVNTTGYKGKSIAFSELLTNRLTDRDGLMNGQTYSINRGTVGAAVKNDTGQGSLLQSNEPFHFAIEGSGFFGIQTTEGLRLTRDGAFSLDGAGQLVNSRGEMVEAFFSVPQNEWPSQQVTVSDAGVVYSNTPTGQIQVGQIRLFEVLDAANLQPAGHNQFVSPGDLVETTGSGKIRQHYLESSSVDLAQTMIQMMTAQRAYSLNLKTIQTTDDLYSVINQINR